MEEIQAHIQVSFPLKALSVRATVPIDKKHTYIYY